jgi:hypothetical protein
MDFTNVFVFAILFISAMLLLVFLIMDNQDVTKISDLNVFIDEVWYLLTSEETSEENE